MFRSEVKILAAPPDLHVEPFDSAILDLAAGRAPRCAFAELLPVAKDHGLGALLAYYFAPDDLEAAAYLRSAAVRQLRLSSLQLRLLNELSEVGIIGWPYKGPTLGARIQAPAPRESRDIDILVSEDQIDRAYEVLLRGRFPHGHEPTIRDHGLRHHSSIVDPKTNIRIELHWSVADPSWSFSPEEILWRQIQELGHPSLDLLFTILAHHAIKHGSLRLVWLNDLVGIARLPDWNLDRTFEYAERTGSRLAVEASSVLIDRLLGVEIPSYQASNRAKQIAQLCEWGIRQRLNHLSGRRLLFRIRWLLIADKRAIVRSSIKGRVFKETI